MAKRWDDCWGIARGLTDPPITLGSLLENVGDEGLRKLRTPRRRGINRKTIVKRARKTT